VKTRGESVSEVRVRTTILKLTETEAEFVTTAIYPSGDKYSMYVPKSVGKMLMRAKERGKVFRVLIQVVDVNELE